MDSELWRPGSRWITTRPRPLALAWPAVSLRAVAEESRGWVLDLAALRRARTNRWSGQGVVPLAIAQEALAGTDAVTQDELAWSMQAFVQADESVIVTGGLTGRLSVPCGRCLQLAEVALAGTFEATFIPAEKFAAFGDVRDVDEDGVLLGNDDLDAWPYDGTLVDLGALLHEQIKLAYPMRAYCAKGERCRGLCAGCGADLNAQPGGPCTACGRLPAGLAADVAQQDPPPTSWQSALSALLEDEPN